MKTLDKKTKTISLLERNKDHIKQSLNLKPQLKRTQKLHSNNLLKSLEIKSTSKNYFIEKDIKTHDDTLHGNRMV